MAEVGRGLEEAGFLLAMESIIDWGGFEFHEGGQTVKR